MIEPQHLSLDAFMQSKGYTPISQTKEPWPAVPPLAERTWGGTQPTLPAQIQKTATQADVEGLANYILDEAQRQNKVCTREQALNAARTILVGQGYIIK